jgi:multidrug efflux pump subunit AcrA (membrane-fusion protein)
MKKYVMLFTFTAAAIIAIVVAGRSVENSMIRVSAYKVAPCTVEDTVTCTGTVEDYPGNSIYAVKPGIVTKLYVKVGDNVSAGQAIMDIIPNATAAATAESSSAAAKAQGVYEQYYKYLQSGGNSGSSAIEAAAQALEDNQKSYTISATNAGTVEYLAVSYEGSYISSNAPAVKIKNDKGMRVRLTVDESQVADLKKGQKVQISGVGFKNSVYSGSIVSIADAAEQAMTTTGQKTVVEVIASVDNPGDDVKPGFTAKAKITTSKSDKVLCVPYEAVREDSNNKEYVFCVADGKVKRVPIVTGKEFDTGFEVKSGLKASDVVILNPDDVSEGQKVIITKMTEGGSTA